MRLSKLIKSKRIWTASIIFIGLFFIKYNPIIVFAAIFGLAIAYNTKTIHPLKNYKFWIVIIMLIIVVPLFTGIQDKSILAIKYSSLQLQKTLLMTLRGISVFLLFQVLTTNLVIEDLIPVFKKLGFNNFDILYNLSNEIFPKIKGILIARYRIFRDNWKAGKSFNVLLNFFVDIFYDFFMLIEQLGLKQNKNYIYPEDLLSKIDGNNNLIIICSDVDTGKTTWIEQCIDQLKINTLNIDGLYSKKKIDSDDQWHHDLIRIASNEIHQLNTMEEIETDTKIGRFFFFEEALKWGNKQLESINNVDWIIIDEIGILEFDGVGLLPGFQKMVQQNEYNIIITIRSSLIIHLDKFLSDYIPMLSHRKRLIIEL